MFLTYSIIRHNYRGGGEREREADRPTGREREADRPTDRQRERHRASSWILRFRQQPRVISECRQTDRYRQT